MKDGTIVEWRDYYLKIFNHLQKTKQAFCLDGQGMVIDREQAEKSYKHYQEQIETMAGYDNLYRNY